MNKQHIINELIEIHLLLISLYSAIEINKLKDIREVGDRVIALTKYVNNVKEGV